MRSRVRFEGGVVVGAGVVGLAIGRALALRGQPVMVLEAASQIGTGVSSRNSEVIHAGLYYPPNSLKARTCIEGREALYRYCAARNIPHRRCGKLVVATSDDQVGRLEDLQRNAELSGAGKLRLLDTRQLRKLEPELRCNAALHAPQSGIIDSHALMAAFARDLKAAGGDLIVSTPVSAISVADGRFTLATEGPEPAELEACRLYLAAGLETHRMSQRLLGPKSLPPLPRLWARGNYFSLTGGKSPFQRLVYPLPEPGGLGIHATPDLSGRIRFGPDVDWIEAPDFRVNASKAPHFEKAIRRYWPTLPADSLVPDYAGIRPKLVNPGEAAADFQVLRTEDHGMPPGAILLGIESPGLTAALALAEVVLDERT